MSKLSQAQNYMQRAINMKDKNPMFAARLFDEAKRLMCEVQA